MKKSKMTLAKKALGVVAALSLTMAMVPAQALARSYWEDEFSAGAGESVSKTIDSVNGAEGGIYVDSSGGGTVDVKVGGDVTARGEASSVEAHGAGSSSTLDIAGNVKSTGEYEDAVSAEAGDGATATVKVGKDAEAGDDAVESFAYGKGSKATVEVNGSASGLYGVTNGAADGGASDVTVKGNATGQYDGVYVTNYPGGTSSTRIDGDVTGGERGAALGTTNVYYGDATDVPSVINLSIGGDLTGKGAEGLYSTSFWEQDKMDVLVEGTISGAKAPVAFRNNQLSSDNLDLTVWKIVPNAAGAVAADEVEGGNGVTYKENEGFEKRIKYIIKVDNPEGADVSAVGADGNALGKSHGFDYALEGDKVFLKVDLEAGYKLVGAFNGEGEKTPLLLDENGNYYVVVPKGGGVYLSVELSSDKYSVTFLGEDGSTLQASTMAYGDMPKYSGATPTKAEDDDYTYEFVGWTPEIDKVTGDIVYRPVFKAVSKATETVTEQLPVYAAAASSPKTGDETVPATAAIATALLAGSIALVASKRRREER